MSIDGQEMTLVAVVAWPVVLPPERRNTAATHAHAHAPVRWTADTWQVAQPHFL